jgi:hypothetical protein
MHLRLTTDLFRHLREAGGSGKYAGERAETRDDEGHESDG